MKKLATFVFSLALIVCFVFGAVGCTNGNSDKPVGDGEITFSEDGSVQNAQTAKNYTAVRSDNRAEAYTAYKKDGTKIGSFKGLANAINSAVSNGGIGAYVTKLNGTTKLFVNNEGYQKDVNDECFWFYDYGTSLDSYWCWDNTDTLGTLKNSKIITAHTQGYGTKSTQTYNSYAVLDKTGAVSQTQDANSYELSTTLDAAVLAFPQRFGGMTKLTYEIDLSNVKITPAYTDGSESSDVYAFMGFYMWQDYYVVNIGIACDVKTGNWYSYIGTSRDDSASNTVYSKDSCVMTSTWNEDGYFVPDSKSITLCIETKLLEDDEGEYQVDDFYAKTSDGSVYSRRMTDSTINSYFQGKPLGIENSYIFVAGLDIKNDIVTGVETENTDYFNGAKFENMAITKAEGYIPTTEEMSDVKYGYQIKLDRGKTYNMLLANGGSDLIDYNVINNNLCTTYEKKDGKDVYSFNYDLNSLYNPVTASELSAKAKTYQDKIDALKVVNASNAFDYADSIDAVAAMYGQDDSGTGKNIADKYWNILDFSAYKAAKQALSEAAELDSEAENFVEGFEALQTLASYQMSGWRAPADASSTDGYLYNDYQTAKALIEDYEALSDSMKIAVFYHINRTAFEDWQLFCDEMDAAESSDNFSDAGFTSYTVGNDIKGTATVINPDKALGQIAYWMLKIKSKTVWGDATTAGKMNYDNSYQPSELLVQCVNYLDSLDIEIPTFYSETLDEIGYASFENNYKALAATIEIGSYWQASASELTLVNEITAEQAEILTKYWASAWAYTDDGILWNIKNNLGGMNSRLANTLSYYLVKDTSYTTFKACFDNVKTVLEGQGYTFASGGKVYAVSEDTIEAKAAVELSTDDLSAEGLSFYNSWKKVGAIETFNMTGWKAEDGATDTTGYLVNTAQTASSLKTLWTALFADDKEAIALLCNDDNISDEIEDWITFNNQLTALNGQTAFTADTKYKTLNVSGADVEITAQQALTQVAYWSYKIVNGGTWESDTPSYLMDADNSWFQSVYIVNCRKIFENAGLVLPDSIKSVLTKIGYDAYYDAYDAIYETVKIAQSIADNSYDSLADLSVDQLAALNKYWVSGYTISTLYSWNWNSGNKFETYMGERVALIVKLAGGTLTENEVSLKCYQYFAKVASFLTQCGYTVNANGWGVTAQSIVAA